MFKKSSFYIHLFLGIFFLWFLFLPLIQLFTYIDKESLLLVLTPEFRRQLQFSLGFASLASLITTILAYILAFITTHSPFRKISYLEIFLFIPLLTPSFFPALSLTYLLGAQGVLHDFFPEFSMQGSSALILCWMYYLLPALYLVQKSGMKSIHGQLYQASQTLKPSVLKTFFNIIWPHTRLSFLNAFLLGLTLCVSDFGIAKVLGSSLPLFSMEIYKNVIGLQNYSLGAFYSLIIILPSLVHKIANTYFKKKEIPLSIYDLRGHERQARAKDYMNLGFLSVMALIFFVLLITPVLVSFTQFWPYNRQFTLDHYQFPDLEQSGFFYLKNSLYLAAITATLGTLVSFTSAYFLEKTPRRWITSFLKWSFFVPLSIPGLSLGIAYVLFFRTNLLWGTWAILIINTFLHFCSTPFVAQSRSLAQLPHSYYQAAQTLRARDGKILWQIYLPLCWPQLLSHFSYLFLNSLTTVSALIFLLPPSKVTSAVAAVNLEDSGDLASATALTSLNVFAALAFLTFIFTAQALTRRFLLLQKESSPVPSSTSVC